MKLFKSKFEFISDSNVLTSIEVAGRNCYRSEDKITTTSSIKFVNNLIANGHEAMIEFGPNIIFKVNWILYVILKCLGPKYLEFSFSNFRAIVSGNNRAWRDLAKKYSIVKAIIKPLLKNEEYKVLFNDIDFSKTKISLEQTLLTKYELRNEKEILNHYTETIKFHCDRGVSHEIVRHRPASYAQSSTRYCNFSLLKFGNQVSFIIPSWLVNVFEDDDEITSNEIADDNSPEIIWVKNMLTSESSYLELLKQGWTPQQARSVLPNSLKTEIIMKANLKEWKHFFFLRTSKAAHPDMQHLVRPLLDEFKVLYSNIFENIKY